MILSECLNFNNKFLLNDKYYVVQELELEIHDIFLSSNYSKVYRVLF